MSGPVAEATAKTPYLVARRLRRLAGSKHMRSDRHALAWIAQAADLISKLTKERHRLFLKVSNYSRERELTEQTRQAAGRRKGPKPLGRFVHFGDSIQMASKISDLIKRPSDLYRTKKGGIRVVKAGTKIIGPEFIGRFDEGADFDCIKEAIE